jgi:TolA-binding protein
MNEFEALARELKRQLPPVPDARVSSQLGRLLRDPRVRRPPLRRRWLVLAVSAAIVGVLFSLPWSPHTRPPVTERWLEAEHSALEQELADGTRLRLDPGARGLASDGEKDGVRFTLEHGRATFDVVPQNGRVFRVMAGKHSVSVLGTRFSVAFEPGGAFNVSVERGSVLVVPAEGSPIRLAAGERFDQGSPPLAHAPRAESVKPADGAPQASAGQAAPSPATPKSRPRPEPRSTAHESRWRQLHRQREYAAALAAARDEGLGRLIDELGPVPLADLADVARLGGDLPVALQVLTAIQRRFPETEQAEQAQFLSGRILVQLGRGPEAATVFESYLGAHPDGQLSTEALGRLLELRANDGDTARARRLAERYLQRAPNGPYRRLARSLILER